MTVLVSSEDLLAEAGQLLEETVALRRRLHTRPEVGLQLPATQAAVLEALDGLNLDVTTGKTASSVVAVLEGPRPGPTTLLRADMDALPMPEETGLPYASTVAGAMHACGHDAHTAMLAGAAKLLGAHREHLAGRVVFMFQPGEEGAGGARAMLDEGLLERHGPIDRAFALHVIPLIPSGMVAGRPGPTMASSDSFEITVAGKGGHASMPADATDPVPVACEIVTALQSMITRRVPAFDPAVLTVGSIQAGTRYSVIPETAVLQVAVKAVSETTRTAVIDGMHRIAEHVAAAHLCTSTVRPIAFPYPVTVSDPPAAEHALTVAAGLLGKGRVLRMPTPVMASEDWSFVLQKVPGCILALGVAPPGVQQPASIHSSRMVLDEAAMTTGIALHAALASSPQQHTD